MKTLAALLAVVLLAAGCSGGESEIVVVGGAERASAGTDPQDVPITPAGTAPQDVPITPAGLAHCKDVPKLGSRFEGALSARQNPDPIITGVLVTYGMEHPDTFGGRWIDRDNGGALVLGFTDDPDAHRQAILDRFPSPDDAVGVRPRPPITDSRPLSDRDDVVIDVVQVRFNETEFAAMADRVRSAIAGRDFGLFGSGTYLSRQRVYLDLVDPPDGALAEIAELVPDPSALCVNVTRTAKPPEGPLDVIPDLDVDDPLVSCWGTPAVPYSQFINPPSIDEVDHPAVDVLQAELDTPGSEPLPRGPWVVISIDDDNATFAVLPDGGFGVADVEQRGDQWTFVAGVERRGDRWIYSGEGSGPPCEPTVPLPAGLARVEVRLDSMPSPADTTISVRVTERGCANGRNMGEALRGPQVIETDEAVLIAFAVVPVAGGATCPGNPPTAVTIELSEPLGQRRIYDGVYFPPKPLAAVADP